MKPKIVIGLVLTVLLVAMLSLSFNIQQAECSEPPETEWIRTYGGTCDDTAYSVVQTSDGGYVIAGSTTCTSDGRWDILLIKTEANGSMEWNKTYGGVGSDEMLRSIIKTADGGYALAGALDDPHYADRDDFLLIKTDASGNMQWNKTYGGASWEFAFSVVQTGDGGYALAGPTKSFGAVGRDFWLVKTDANGNMEWNKTYGKPVDDDAESIIQTGDGGYAILGSTHTGYANWDMWLVKTDENGTEQWNETYGGMREEFGEDLVQTDDWGYALGGFTYSFGAGQSDFWLVKTNATGHVVWHETYGDGDYDDAFSLIQTTDSGYALAGQSGGSQTYDKDAWLVKTDASGKEQWNFSFGDSLYDIWYDLVQTTDGGYALAGINESSTKGDDFWLIKLAPTAIHATIDIDPDTLNLKSKGKWITAYIELPESYNVSDIDVSTILLNDTVPAEWSDIQDNVLMVKFNRIDVISLLDVGNQTIKMTGQLKDGTLFEGTDTIRAIHHRSHLFARLIELDMELVYASTNEKSAIFKEIVDIGNQWAYAPP